MMAILIRIGEPTFKYPFPTNYNTKVSTKKGGAVISLAEVTSWKSNNIFGVIYVRERERERERERVFKPSWINK